MPTSAGRREDRLADGANPRSRCELDTGYDEIAYLVEDNQALHLRPELLLGRDVLGTALVSAAQ